jgi:hypothetical protein
LGGGSRDHYSSAGCYCQPENSAFSAFPAPVCRTCENDCFIFNSCWMMRSAEVIEYLKENNMFSSCLSQQAGGGDA